MTRLVLCLAVAGFTGAAARPATSATRPAPVAAQAKVTMGAGARAFPAPEGWLQRYGVYNARQGAWELIPSGPGC